MASLRFVCLLRAETSHTAIGWLTCQSSVNTSARLGHLSPPPHRRGLLQTLGSDGLPQLVGDVEFLSVGPSGIICGNSRRLNLHRRGTKKKVEGAMEALQDRNKALVCYFSTAGKVNKFSLAAELDCSPYERNRYLCFPKLAHVGGRWSEGLKSVTFSIATHSVALL